MSETLLRRIPQQQRSRQKLQLALDAADELLARGGAGALSTTRIAGRAGMSVGTVYQYFPDKEAIAEALARRYWAEFAALIDEAAARADSDPVGSLLDALADGFRSRPGFRALWFGGLRTERVREVTRPTRDAVAATVTALLARHWPGSSRAQYGKVARMVVLVGDGLLREAFRISERGDRLVLSEGREMLDAYIQARLA
jgi:AcrR family transcriptional regulator